MNSEKWKVLVLFWVGFLISENHLIAQCGSNTFLGNDTSICQSETLNLTGPSNYLSFLWSTSATSPNISVSTPGTYWCKATKMDTGNLVTNGDFSSGNSGYTTESKTQYGQVTLFR